MHVKMRRMRQPRIGRFLFLPTLLGRPRGGDGSVTGMPVERRPARDLGSGRVDSILTGGGCVPNNTGSSAMRAGRISTVKGTIVSLTQLPLIGS